MAIADRIQLEGADSASATTASLDAFRELLAAGRVLSAERQMGLFGELLVLEHILNRAPPEAAIACWRGPLGEEHDFDVGEGDVEVKTTTSEGRRHWIGSLGQLCPSVGRPLWLASIQLTGAGIGGTSLAELIARIENRLTGNAIEAFNDKLLVVGWTDQYTRDAARLRRRSAPAIYAVDDAFPAITSRELERLRLGADKIVQLTYMLDLSSVSMAEEAPNLIKDIASEESP
ncbi:MAG TPA: PD-(D/E)XK motif protein [Polyangiaceae bacterium]|nr:PD-(D/E)XK motif protein [Polyangiaceae bacterium]